MAEFLVQALLDYKKLVITNWVREKISKGIRWRDTRYKLEDSAFHFDMSHVHQTREILDVSSESDLTQKVYWIGSPNEFVATFSASIGRSSAIDGA